jgi:hypothetical protein
MTLETYVALGAPWLDSGMVGATEASDATGFLPDRPDSMGVILALASQVWRYSAPTLKPS